MAYYKVLIADKCYLSLCSVDDASGWVERDNDLEVAIPLCNEAHTPYPLERHRETLEEVMRSQGHVFTVVDLGTDDPIGRCTLFNVDHVNRKATLGMAIGEKASWNQGYGQETTALRLDYAFNLLNLNSVMLGTFAFSERAIHCYQKVGFKEIGRRREARIIAGVR
jgi:RimJ/RimL family protein N-acetyltransferase